MQSVNYAECRKQAHYAECRYAGCRFAAPITPTDIRLSCKWFPVKGSKVYP